MRCWGGAEVVGDGLVVVFEDPVLGDWVVGVADIGANAWWEGSRVYWEVLRGGLLGSEVLVF